MIERIESGIAARSMGFRELWSIKEEAKRLGVKGVVFNRGDGSVKIIAEGERPNLQEFAMDLESVGHLHTVENFWIKWAEPTGEFKDFVVNH